MYSCVYFCLPAQEEIKIISIEVYVNPYAEPDEEEEAKANEDKIAEDEENVSLRLFMLLLCFPMIFSAVEATPLSFYLT